MSSDPTHNWRPDIAATVIERADFLGRRQPRRIGPLAFMRAIPGLRDQFSEVPPEYWAEDVTAEGMFSCAVVSCPCGQSPSVEIGTLGSCPGCPRIFYYTGRAVLVANSPKTHPRQAPDDSSASGDAGDRPTA